MAETTQSGQSGILSLDDSINRQTHGRHGPAA